MKTSRFRAAVMGLAMLFPASHLGLLAIGCTSDRECLEGCLCKQRGLCRAGEGKCVAKHDAECARSNGCKAMGLCKAVLGRCQAKVDEDCRASEFCTRAGMCSAEAGRCTKR